MTAPVRRLVLDISPWVWAYIVFQSAIALLLDFTWAAGPSPIASIMPGFLLVISATMTAQKVPAWHTLPVKGAEIDRARWWQSVGGPGIILAVLLLGSASVLATFGRLHAAWTDILLAMLGQFAAVVTVATLMVITPLAANKWGRLSTLLLIPLLLVYLRVLLTTGERTDIRPQLAVAGGAAILAAIALYLTAGRWPLPLTTALWNLPSKTVSRPTSSVPASGLRGWPVLLWANLPTLALLWAVTALLPLAMKWFLPKIDLGVSVWFMAIAAVAAPVSSAATSMRSLRALPLSGWELTMRIVLLLLTVQAISLAIIWVVSPPRGELSIAPVFALAMMAVSSIFFPVALRFGLRVIQFSYGFAIIFFLLFEFLAANSRAVPWIITGSLAVMAANFVWGYWEISRGRHAYRVQPLVPQRWRGLG